MFLSAAKADSRRLSVQEHSPGADERSVEAFHQHIQSSEFTQCIIYIISWHLLASCLVFYHRLAITHHILYIYFLLPSRYAAELRTCYTLHWEPTISAAEIWSLTSLSSSTQTTAASHSSSSKYDSPLCALQHRNSPKFYTFNNLNVIFYTSRVPCTVSWGITMECAWPICTTGSASLWRGPPSYAPVSAQPCLWRSPPLCGSSTTSRTKFIVSTRPSGLTSL